MPRSTSRTPGEPAQKNVNNRDRAAKLAEDSNLTNEVRDLYRNLQAAIQNRINKDLEEDRREAER